MSVQHLNDVKAIARTAQQLGATLPATSAPRSTTSTTSTLGAAPHPSPA